MILAQAVAGDPTGLSTRPRQMEEMASEGRYSSGPCLPALSRGFAAFEQGDAAAAIRALEPFANQSDRISGSRAQHDLVGFTLMKAYLDAGRLDDSRRRLLRAAPGCGGRSGRRVGRAALNWGSGMADPGMGDRARMLPGRKSAAGNFTAGESGA